MSPNSKLLYTWHDPAGDRVLLWAHGTKHMDNDLRKDGIGKFKYENTDEQLWWISFLDGTQRILLFSKNDSIASGTQATNRFNQVTQEISVAIHGIGLSLVNSIAQKDVMYVGIASSGNFYSFFLVYKVSVLTPPLKVLFGKKRRNPVSSQ